MFEACTAHDIIDINTEASNSAGIAKQSWSPSFDGTRLRELDSDLSWHVLAVVYELLRRSKQRMDNWC